MDHNGMSKLAYEQSPLSTNNLPALSGGNISFSPDHPNKDIGE
jgi:hypothetical protein